MERERDIAGLGSARMNEKRMKRRERERERERWAVTAIKEGYG